MHFASIESSRTDMGKHNETMRANAKARLVNVNLLMIKGNREGFKRVECAPNRKAKAKLNARISDWQRTIDDPLNRNKDMTGYKKPGSYKFN